MGFECNSNSCATASANATADPSATLRFAQDDSVFDVLIEEQKQLQVQEQGQMQQQVQGLVVQRLLEVGLYYTYIVASCSHTYIGMTSDLMKRIWQYKEGNFNGYSKQYKCNRLVWFEGFAAVLDAIAREKQLKGWRRAKKIALIESKNATWLDLSEGWGSTVPSVEIEG